VNDSLKLHLPAPGSLVQTGPVDSIEQYYRPFIGSVMRSRLRWVLEALPTSPLDRVLEVGYGSGVFQYTLARFAGLSVGLDLHTHGPQVLRALNRDGVPSLLVRADGANLPFSESTFDAVIIVSVLEFVPDPRRCLQECWRVVKPGGRVIGVRPRQLLWSDAVCSVISGTRPESWFKGGRARVQDALAALCPPIHQRRRPRWLPASEAPYELLVWERES
jgi:SAM-dependent methyltransferase